MVLESPPGHRYYPTDLELEAILSLPSDLQAALIQVLCNTNWLFFRITTVCSEQTTATRQTEEEGDSTRDENAVILAGRTLESIEEVAGRVPSSDQRRLP
jgi:hypothetical protein